MTANANDAHILYNDKTLCEEKLPLVSVQICLS